MEEQIELTLSESQLRFIRIALMESISSPNVRPQLTVAFEKTLEEVTRQYLGEFA